MKKLWTIFVTLLLCAAASAQVTQFSSYYRSNYTAVTTDAGISTIGSGTTFYKISWNAINAPATCTFTVDSSANNSTWTTGGVLASTTCTGTGASAIIPLTTNYFRVNVTAISGTNAAVTVIVAGYAAVSNGTILWGSCAGTIGATTATTYNLAPFGSGSGFSCTATADTPGEVPYAGVASHLRVRCGTAPTTALPFAMKRNGGTVGTPTCTVGGGATTCQDNTTTLTYNVGDTFSFQAGPTGQATETAANCRVTVQYQ